MVPYYGDFPASATVYIPINTFDSNDPAASVTVTNLVNTDVHIHKDGGTTQRNNAAGITMTVDFDSITGNHLLIIDTSDNTVADFWEAGHEYQVRIEGATVDGGTINAWVGSFSIERAGGALALIKSATYGLSALKTLLDTTGIKVASFADNAITAASINADAITNAKIADNAIAAENLAADCITSAKIADNAFANEHFAAGALTSTEITSAAGCIVASIANNAITAAAIATDAIDADALKADALAEIADAVWDEASTGHTDAGKAGAQLWTVLDDVPNTSEFQARTLPAADYTVVSDLGTVQTGDAFARLGAPAGESVSADIAAIKAETAAIVADTNELQVDDYPTSIAAVKTVVDLIEDILRNKMEITDANGNLVLYEDDGTTPKYSVNACVTDDATTTIRKRLE